MSDQELELEVKFYVNSLEEIETRIIKLDASLVQPRTREYNLVFDNKSGDLTKNNQILRLRKDMQNFLTFKGPGKIVDGVHIRKEIEIEVSDFDQTKSILEALGYQVSFSYEKLRSVYKFDRAFVTLDEMPFGNFIEVEGRDSTLIEQLSLKLGLSWEHRILCSYLNLYDEIKKSFGQLIENLTFSDFENIIVTPDMLRVIPADG